MYWLITTSKSHLPLKNLYSALPSAVFVKLIVNCGTTWYRYSASAAPNTLPIAGRSLSARGSPNSASTSEM